MDNTVDLRVTARATGSRLNDNHRIVGHVVSGSGKTTHYGALHSDNLQDNWRKRHNDKPIKIQHKTIDSFCI